MKKNTEADYEKLLRLPDVMDRSGLKRSTIYLRVRQGRFPRQIQLGDPHVVAWRETEITAWVNAQIAAAGAAIVAA